eukprot:TRINITY_DN14982_c0_g1_i1.p1 TRINITY_DN14982_c0_g1~~TRINITY_DN14982_c0_g1_i1.p1  ORF type:complete len:237 (-),score=54.82 TRINITY_DN14982_c0_g1_i1:127-816(-)
MSHNSLTALNSPSQCHLKLICAILQSGDRQLTNSHFMQGISTLSDYKGNHPLAPGLKEAIRAGAGGSSCSSVAPNCLHSENELLFAVEDLGLKDTAQRARVKRQVLRRRPQDLNPERQQPKRRRRPLAESPYGYNPNRRQGLNIPPIFRPENAGQLQVCKSCDQRGMVCTVYGIGTFIGCNGIALAAGPGGPAACNAATTPGSIGCGINTLYCYSNGCGLISLPRLPGR